MRQRSLNRVSGPVVDLDIRGLVSFMSRVEIYISPLCGYCYAAKQLLNRKKIEFREYDVAFDPARKHEMLQRSQGRRTVPQIFVDSVAIGGFDDLNDLEKRNGLDDLLKAQDPCL